MKMQQLVKAVKKNKTEKWREKEIVKLPEEKKKETKKWKKRLSACQCFHNFITFINVAERKGE